jgi:hypothetical protein
LQLEHTPETMDAWGTTRRTRCHGQPVAVDRALAKGPLVSALRTYDWLVLCPIQPLTLARYRAAFPPRRAKDAPPEAALQLARLLTHRAKLPPLTPQRASWRALPHLVAHRRRVGGAQGRLPHRLPRTLKP